MIKIEYDGSYPSTCMGTLTVIIDDKIVYEKSGFCESTGRVCFDDDWNEHVVKGELIFNDPEAMKESWFTKEVKEAIRNKLLEFDVCCGGCV
jgi:hypothetical protein